MCRCINATRSNETPQPHACPHAVGHTRRCRHVKDQGASVLWLPPVHLHHIHTLAAAYTTKKLKRGKSLGKSNMPRQENKEDGQITAQKLKNWQQQQKSLPQQQTTNTQRLGNNNKKKKNIVLWRSKLLPKMSTAIQGLPSPPSPQPARWLGVTIA